MRKVDHKAEIFKVKDVHPARCLRCRWNKGFERDLDILCLKIAQESSQCGSQHILNHKRNGAAKCNRDQRGALHTDLPVAFLNGNKAIFVNTGNAAFFAVRFYNSIVLVQAKISNFAMCVLDRKSVV